MKPELPASKPEPQLHMTDDDRGGSHDDMGGLHDDRGSLVLHDDRGGLSDDRRGLSDDRQGSHDDRGGSHDDMGGLHDDRGSLVLVLHDDMGGLRDDRRGLRDDRRGSHNDRPDSHPALVQDTLGYCELVVGMTRWRTLTRPPPVSPPPSAEITYKLFCPCQTTDSPSPARSDTQTRDGGSCMVSEPMATTGYRNLRLKMGLRRTREVLTNKRESFEWSVTRIMGLGSNLVLYIY